LFAHDPFRKPASTYPDRALGLRQDCTTASEARG
jgi:hypothetical protein